jgi:hypothetical protein
MLARDALASLPPTPDLRRLRLSSDARPQRARGACSEVPITLLERWLMSAVERRRYRPASRRADHRRQ